MLNSLVILTSLFSGHIKDKRNIYMLKKNISFTRKKRDSDMIQQYYAQFTSTSELREVLSKTTTEMYLHW